MTSTFIEKVLLFGIAGGVGIVCKIVFDWLATSKAEPDEHHCDGKCVHHEDLGNRVSIIERCNMQIKREQSSIAASFSAHADQVNRRLDQGNENFQALRKDIGRISTSLTTIATIVDERSKRNIDQGFRRRKDDSL